MRLSGHRILRIPLEGVERTQASLDSLTPPFLCGGNRQGSVAASAQTARQMLKFPEILRQFQSLSRPVNFKLVSEALFVGDHWNRDEACIFRSQAVLIWDVSFPFLLPRRK